MSRHTYIELAFVCILIACFTGLVQRVNLDCCQFVIREPNITLSDLLYFELMHLTYLFGILALVFLCMGIQKDHNFQILTHLLYVLGVFGILIFGRCIFNIINYHTFSLVEISADLLFVTLLFTHKLIGRCYYWMQGRQRKTT